MILLALQQWYFQSTAMSLFLWLCTVLVLVIVYCTKWIWVVLVVTGFTKLGKLEMNMGSTSRSQRFRIQKVGSDSRSLQCFYVAFISQHVFWVISSPKFQQTKWCYDQTIKVEKSNAILSPVQSDVHVVHHSIFQSRIRSSCCYRWSNSIVQLQTFVVLLLCQCVQPIAHDVFR